MIVLLACVENTLERREPEVSGAPAIRVEPTLLSFGAWPYMDSASLPLTLANDGEVALELTSVRIGGLGGGAFTLPVDPSGTTLAPGEERSYDVVYTALSPSVEDGIRVGSDDPANPAVYVSLLGEGAFGLLSVDPSPVDFGNTEAGVVRTLDAALENIGGADLTIDSLLVTGDTYALASEVALPLTLEPGQESTIQLTFSPLVEGRYAGMLWAMTDDPVGLHNVSLQGSAGLAYEDTDTTSDPCAESEYGTDLHAGTRIFVEDDSAPVVVTYLGTNAGYTNELWIDAPESRRLATGYDTPIGTEVALGPYAVGTELIFSDVVLDTGDRFEAGPGTRNADGMVHAATTYLGDCSWKLGFEDLYGGGDRDYDDIQMQVSGVLGQSE